MLPVGDFGQEMMGLGEGIENQLKTALVFPLAFATKEKKNPIASGPNFHI